MPSIGGSERIVFVVKDGVADVRLNRPDKLNAIDHAMFTALATVGAALRERSDVRAVVLSGTGRAFCAGLDLAVFRAFADGQPRGAEVDNPPDGLPEDGLSRGQRAVMAWRSFQVPVIAAIHGPAVGAGLQLAMAADIRLVASDATLGLPEITFGITPDMGGTQLLPRLVGPDVAADLILTGRTVDGAEAVRLGLATRIAADPVAEALRTAYLISAANPNAVRSARSLLGMAHSAPLAEGLAAERAAMHRLVGSPDQRAAAATVLQRKRR